MGISSALYSGVSGLNTNAQAMSVIGNNLANTNTVGFKVSRSVFSDLLSASVNGSGGFSQVGRGVGLSSVDQVFSQGTFESTESSLDVAIEGDGFFILKAEDTDTSFYSRAGAFRFDDGGYLVNPEGLRVQGKAFDADGNFAAGDATDIQVVSSGLIAGNVTNELTLTTNLDSNSAEKDPALFATDDAATYDYASSTTIYDSLGNAQQLTTYFSKSDTAANTWSWGYSFDRDDGTGTDTIETIRGTFQDSLVFGGDGELLAATTGVVPAIEWNNGSDNTVAIDIVFDTTQFNSESIVISQEQNGFGAGNLTGVDFDEDGIVTASYSNGESIQIAQVVLGRFINPNGLQVTGRNLFIETTTSGAPRTGLPGPELGNIFTNSLEQSGVDMGAEFVKMITVQRGFQANSKIITTVDELLGELINLKR